MSLYTDQINRSVEIIHPPRKIVSVVPSQTELLHDLGLDQEVVGITKFCIHPGHWFRKKMRVGGTKQLDLQKIKRLKPDLILANKEENLREEIEALAKEFPVWISDISSLEDALDMIRSIGEIIERTEQAGRIVNIVQQEFSTYQPPVTRPKVCYLIWREPYMTVGGDTFISDMLCRAGFENMFNDAGRYPQITVEQLKVLEPEVLFLSSEPYPFKEKHLQEFQRDLPHTKIMLVDGEMFSWYGSRMMKAPAYFQQLQIQVLSLSHAAGNR